MMSEAPAPLFLDGQTAIPVEGVVLPALPDVVTLECEECPEKFTGPSGGKGSASFLLGKHRYAKHGITKSGARKAPAGRAKSTEVIEPDGTLVSTLHEAAGQVTGSGTPSARALAQAFGYLANTATLTAAGWAVDSDPLIAAQLEHPDEAVANAAATQRELLVQALTLDAKQAAQIAAPIARLLQPTSLNKRYGRAVVDNSDLGPALAAVVEIGRNWREFLIVRRQHVRALQALQAPPAPSPGITPPTGPPPPATVPVPAAVPAVVPAVVPGPLGAGVVAQPTYR